MPGLGNVLIGIKINLNPRITGAMNLLSIACVELSYAI
jgi:hypothetical protein